jgi:hypothetical protein
MRLLSVISLGSGVTGGEGLAVHAGPGGPRTLFVAAEHAPADFVAVDVTDPRPPAVVYRNSIPTGVRSNNLAIIGDLLAVTRQANEPGGNRPGWSSSTSPRRRSPPDSRRAGERHTRGQSRRGLGGERVLDRALLAHGP